MHFFIICTTYIQKFHLEMEPISMFEQAIEKREKMIYFAERYGMTSQNSGL